MNVVVLCGGTSTERDVSISSGKLICKALEKKGYNTVLLDVYLGIDSYSNDTVFGMGEQGLKVKTNVGENAPDISHIKAMRQNAEVFFGPNVLNICKLADIVFIALHGENGENGKVQASFDLLGIKYTGTGYEGSLLGMSKDLTRKVLIAGGVNMAKGITLYKEDSYESVKDKLFIPAVVKPASGGSSIGVAIVQSEQELKDAITLAKKYDDVVVVEEYIKGREFSIGLLDGKALPIIEIIPKQGFYDYKNKYQSGLTEEICPANLDSDNTMKMKCLAEKAYKSLGLEVYSRIDFILSEQNIPYCLEANTLPGMTPTSLLPQEAIKVGINYEELCEEIIKLSLRKYQK